VRVKLFHSLRIRNFRLYATGQVTKLTGVWMLYIAQDWLVLDLSHNSATALGWTTALQFIPVLLLTLYGGKLADRYDKRRLLVLANAFFAVQAAVLAALVLAHAVRLWEVFVFAAGCGLVQAIENPVRQAFWSELVPSELLPNALSLGSATFNTARLVGPAIAGVGIAIAGTGPVMTISALLATAPVVLILRMRPGDLYRDLPDNATTSAGSKVVDGLRYVWRRPDLIQVLLLVTVVGMLGFNFQLLLAVLAKTVFHTGAAAFGVLTSALAIGALGGSLGGARRRSRPSVYVVVGAALAFGVLETVLALAPYLWFASVLAVPTGFFMIYFAQSANQRVQLGVDALFRGRVMALHVLLFLGTTPVGAPLMGWLAERYGPRTAIVVGGVGSLLAAMAIGLVVVRRARASVRLHLRPRPHVHVRELATGGAAPIELRLPEPRTRAAGPEVRSAA
jgi:MFS family permease